MSRRLGWIGTKELYQGWWILAGGCFTYAIGFGVAIFSIPILYTPLEQEFGWSRSVSTSLFSAMPLVLLLTSPFVGMLLDRLRLSAILIPGYLATAIGLVLLSSVNSKASFFVAASILGAGLSLTNASPVYYFLLHRWFRKNYGTAVGIVLTAGSAAGVIAPPIMTSLMQEFGWRHALVIMSGIVLILPSIVAHFVIAKLPVKSDEAYQREFSLDKGLSLAPVHSKEVYSSQVLKEPRFWIIAIVLLACLGVNFFGVNHLVVHLRDTGVSAEKAAFSLSALFAGTALGKALLGVVSDRFSPKLISAGCIFVISGLTPVLFGIETLNVIYALAFVHGVCYGGLVTVPMRLAVGIFGDSLNGLGLGILSSASALGIIIGSHGGGLFYDIFGSYRVITFVLAFVGTAAAALLMWLSASPARRNGAP